MFKFDLLENEVVNNIYRQNEVILFKPVLVVFVSIYCPWYFLLKYDLVLTYDRLLFFWTTLVFLYALNKYLLWLANVYMVTSKRLVCVHYKNLLSKKVLEAPLDKILNISFSKHGFWRTLFDFGSVQVQAPGLPEPLLLKDVSHPSQVKDLLWKLLQKVHSG